MKNLFWSRSICITNFNIRYSKKKKTILEPFFHSNSVKLVNIKDNIVSKQEIFDLLFFFFDNMTNTQILKEKR